MKDLDDIREGWHLLARYDDGGELGLLEPAGAWGDFAAHRAGVARPGAQSQQGKQNCRYNTHHFVHCRTRFDFGRSTAPRGVDTCYQPTRDKQRSCSLGPQDGGFVGAALSGGKR